jgi:hypothetical protein
MSRKKSERDAAVEKIIDLLAEQIEQMTPEQAKALSADFKSFSQQLRRSVPAERPSRSAKEEPSRPRKRTHTTVSRKPERATPKTL